MPTWSATVLDSVQTGNAVETSVVLTDGVSIKFVQRYVYDGSQASLESLVQQTITSWSNASKLAPVPNGTVLNTTPPAPSVSPPPNVALNTFSAKYATWRKYQNGVALGVYLATDAVVLQAKADAVAAYDTKTAAFLDVLLP